MASDKDQSDQSEPTEKQESSDSTSFDVPEINKDASLKIEQQQDQTSDVPETDVDANLNIERLTKEDKIPESKLNASLKIEEAEIADDSRQDQASKKIFIIGGVGVVVITMAILGFVVLQIRDSASQVNKEVTVVTQSQVGKKEEVRKFVRGDWSFEVLNGSGVKGAARELADKLIELGYQVIKTGNTDRSNYKQTELYISKELMDKSDLLLKDLEKELNIASISGELEDSTASARIIIGTK